MIATGNTELAKLTQNIREKLGWYIQNIDLKRVVKLRFCDVHVFKKYVKLVNYITFERSTSNS